MLNCSRSIAASGISTDMSTAPFGKDAKSVDCSGYSEIRSAAQVSTSLEKRPILSMMSR